MENLPIALNSAREMAEQYGIQVARDFEIEVSKHYHPYIKAIFDNIYVCYHASPNSKQNILLGDVLGILKNLAGATYPIISVLRAIDEVSSTLYAHNFGKGLRRAQRRIHKVTTSGTGVLDAEMVKLFAEMEMSMVHDAIVEQRRLAAWGVKYKHRESDIRNVSWGKMTNLSSIRTGDGEGGLSEEQRVDLVPNEDWSAQLRNDLADFRRLHEGEDELHQIVTVAFFDAVDKLEQAYYQQKEQRLRILPENRWIQTMKLKYGVDFGLKYMASSASEKCTCLVCGYKLGGSPENVLMRRRDGGTLTQYRGGRVLQPRNFEFGIRLRLETGGYQRRAQLQQTNYAEMAQATQLLQIEAAGDMSIVDRPSENEEEDEEDEEDEDEIFHQLHDNRSHMLPSQAEQPARALPSLISSRDDIPAARIAQTPVPKRRIHITGTSGRTTLSPEEYLLCAPLTQEQLARSEASLMDVIWGQGDGDVLDAQNVIVVEGIFTELLEAGYMSFVYRTEDELERERELIEEGSVE